MVVPIRDSENIFFSKSATTMTLNRMSFARVNSIDMDDIHEESTDNYNNVKSLTIFPAKPL